MVHIPTKLKPTFVRNKTSFRNEACSNGTPGLQLKVAILQARDLTAKDRTGASDPYLILKLDASKYTTKVVSKDLNPTWDEEATITLQQGWTSYRLEAVCWDHDKFTRKDYLGEFNVNLKHYFQRHSSSFADATPKWFKLTSFRNGRKSSKVSGAVQLKLWLEDKSNPAANEAELLAAWDRFVATIDSREGSKLANAAPERPVGMQMAEEEDSMALVQDAAIESDESEVDSLAGRDSDLEELSEMDTNISVGAATSGKTKSSRSERRKQRKLRKQKPFHFKTASAQDVLGVVFLEIDSAQDLPRERNLTKTGFDMDPFVITSFSKKSFRTRVIRHSLNPVFHDKLLLQVHKHEEQYSMRFTIVDRDKLSGNDLVGDCEIAVQELIKGGPRADPETGLYALARPDASPPSTLTPRRRLAGIKMLSRTNTGSSTKESDTSFSSAPDVTNSDTESLSSRLEKLESQAVPSQADVFDAMKTFSLPLNLVRKDFWGDKHKPVLQFKAKFVPYPALRQQFWRVILRHYDADETGDISKVELTTMLDSLGATLKESTIDSFFKRFGPKNSPTFDVDGSSHYESLTVDQCIICLEDQLVRSQSIGMTANHGAAHQQESGPPPVDAELASTSLPTVEENQVSKGNTAAGPASIRTNEEAPKHDALAEDDSLEQEEYLITLSQCPLCQKTNMDKKSAVDIVTHLATCASQDWRKVDHLVMGDFVTPSQAQRKWYTKIISKVGYGGYKLGANSANILVQDRKTGQIQEERMSVYVRLGIRLLYKGLKSSRMETARIRRMLKSLSVKQGQKYDAPSSAKDIPSFIAFHHLDMNEVLDPLNSFKSFNEFFYRKLKPGARPCTEPNDPRIAVSPSDCRSVVFNKLTEATEIWVKGQNFSLKRLFGDAYPGDVARFDNGSLGIFRLAPQDYHRFHIPVDGVLGEPKTIDGQYYTVNPMAIRSNLDVYGENVRVLVPIDTKEFGRVMVICVGAMMVGSTVITAKPGSRVSRTDELGYFKFGGSTILLIFEPGRFVFDEDIRANAKLSIETLLRVGSSIGHPPGMRDAINEGSGSAPATEAEKKEASRRISGAFLPPQESDYSSPMDPRAVLENAKEALSPNKVM